MSDEETYWDGTPYMKLKDIEAEMVVKYGSDRGVPPYRMPDRTFSPQPDRRDAE